MNPTTPTTTPPTQTLGFMGGEQYNVNNGVATAANAQAQTALQSLGVPNYSTYVPPKPAQYPVVSADMAIQDLNSKQQNFQQIQQGMAGQQALNAQAQAAQAQQSAVTAQSDAEKAKADALKSATTALTGVPKSETTISLEQVNQQAEKAYEDYKLQIDQLRNGTFPLSPSDQAQIDYVKRQFDQLKQQQLIANKNFEGLQNQLGNTSGRSRYAPEIQTQILQNTINEGLQKISDIEAQAANTVAQLQSAFEEKNYTRINQSYKALTDYLNQKSNTINQIAQNVREEAQLSLERHKQDYQEQQDEINRKLDLQHRIDAVASEAAKYGADQATLEKIQTAGSVGEAIINSGNYLSAEFRQQLKQQEFDNQVKLQQLAVSRANLAISQRELQLKEQEAANAGLDMNNLIAYAQQYASTGQIPTGLPKGAFGAVASVASSLPKSNGTLVDKNTGVRPSGNDTKINAYADLYSAVQLAKQLKELDKQRTGGVVAGTLGKVFGSDNQQRYLDLKDQITDLLTRARTGAALNSSEEKFYGSMLPGRFNEPLYLGVNSQTKIDNFISNLSSDLTNKLNAQGWSMYGISKVKIEGQDYKVGDIITNGQQKGRVNPDGSISPVE